MLLFFYPIVIQQNLVSPYIHSHWDDIPADLKDPKGNWCTEYWGAQAFVINTDIVKNPPTSFKELLAGNYKNMVGIDGDPRQATDALDAVYSAALASSGSVNDIQPGIDYFAALKKKGNFTSARSNIANITKGEVGIAIMWDYLGEFTLASLFSIYTFPIFLDVTGQNRAREAALLAILSFILTLLCVLGIIFLVRLRPGGAGREDQIEIAAAK